MLPLLYLSLLRFTVNRLYPTVCGLFVDSVAIVNTFQSQRNYSVLYLVLTLSCHSASDHEIIFIIETTNELSLEETSLT